MKKIEIDNDVWEALQEKAIPLEDTPNTVLRKIFGLSNIHEEHRSAGTRRQSSSGGRAKGRTPQHTFREPILRSLYNAGGSEAVREVLNYIEKELGTELNDVDRQLLNSGRDIRWRNAAQWERAVMVQEGILKADSPRGVWELTSKGMQIAQEES